MMSEPGRHLARIVLATFLVTFVTARILVYLIMARRIPDLFLHLGGTHIHHLNYGIFLLSAVGAYLLLARPIEGRRAEAAAAIYAIGLALTFDEFGMWLHLGGSYWQRASFDGVAVVGAILALLAVAPDLRSLQPRHFAVAALIALSCTTFFYLWGDSFKNAAVRLDQSLEQLEAQGPQ